MTKYLFYDVETLENVFSVAAYNPDTNSCLTFILIDPKDKDTLLPPPDAATGEITWQACVDITRASNPANFKSGALRLFDLHHPHTLEIFAKLFGVFDTSLAQASNYALVNDTDVAFNDSVHGYLLGYNSYNYDTTMVALFEEEAYIFDKNTKTVEPAPNLFAKDRASSTSLTKRLRAWSDQMFSDGFKSRMSSVLLSNLGDSIPTLGFGSTRRDRLRRAMLMSGRYIDVARLNEKQGHMALKRQLASIGRQIKEHSKLSGSSTRIKTPKDLAELIAYNVSDVVNLWELFKDPVYQSAFSVKANMLETYPELVFDITPKTTPVLGQTKVRNNRLFRDSSSQQLTSRALCPDGRIPDDDTLSFTYPRTGVSYANNICDQTWNFALSCAETMRKNNAAGAEQFLDDVLFVLNGYKNMEGKDFNTSSVHISQDKTGQTNCVPTKFSEYSKQSPIGGCICYYDAQGNQTSCYASFSVGGVHGAEYNKKLFDADVSAYNDYLADYDALYNYALALDKDNPAQALRCSVARLKDPIPFDFPSGKHYLIKDFLANTTKSNPAWKTRESITQNKPQLFKSENGIANAKLNDRYSYTSVGFATHEDFTSYYPNLLRLMRAFDNPQLGYDRYGEMFDQKQEFGRLMKDSSLSADERALYKLDREGVKLILNTASGAGDADFDNPIRSNNKVIAMRIIGQMFTWRIAQAQAMAGARIVSTNTDGIYVVGDYDKSTAILAKQSADIGVEIEPEQLGIVSKDSNNRIEFVLDDASPLGYKILGASGSTLACYKGPSPARALAHPAVIDAVLGHYLIQTAIAKGQSGLNEPFNRSLALKILQEQLDSNTSNFEHVLMMFQNVICASPAVTNYPFACSGAGDVTDYLGHYTRVFYIKEDAPLPYIHLQAATGRKVTDAMKKVRTRENLRVFQHDKRALNVIAYETGISEDNARMLLEREGREGIVKKISSVDPAWHIYVENSDLRALDQAQAKALIDALDLGIYLDLVETSYKNNWHNKTPEQEIVLEQEPDTTSAQGTLDLDL